MQHIVELNYNINIISVLVGIYWIVFIHIKIISINNILFIIRPAFFINHFIFFMILNQIDNFYYYKIHLKNIHLKKIVV